MTQVSIYSNIKEVNSDKIIDIDLFLDNVKSGHWQDQVLAVRVNKEEKKNLPNITLSGTFSTRRDTALLEHSGFICIDIDDCDPNLVKEQLTTDEHCYACFTSCSGYGIAALFKITPSKHRDAFYGLGAYLKETYNFVIDPSCINVSRTRFVSYDPDLYVNPGAKKFTKYLAKLKPERKSKVVFVQNDFEHIVKQICSRNIDITYHYEEWVRIGFGISDKFGEEGRIYFHMLSEVSSKYNYATCEKQYTRCLNAKGSGITIATLYWYAKKEGVETYSKETIEIIKKANSLKRAGMDNQGIIDNLMEFADFSLEDLNLIVPQVDKDIQIDDLSLVEEVESFIRMNYQIRRNVISRNIEIDKNGVFMPMKNTHFNSLFIQIKKQFEKVSFDLIERLIISEETVEYNPFEDFLTKHQHRTPKGLIKKLSNCITSDYGLDGDLRAYYITKWFCGMISSMHGKHSPLMLVLSGKTQNTGKSEFFRRLLPAELKQYYAESKLDTVKDDDILMTQKLIIMDDEMGGKSKREAARLKELTSKQTFSLREPYGRNNVDLERVAVLCGTSNLDDLLNDPTGNRRIIPVNVISIDHAAYNSIDKIDLMMEAYHLYQSGYKWEMSKEDILRLSENTENFEAVSIEEELIFKYYDLPKRNGEGKYYTTSEIMVDIEAKTRQKITTAKIGSILQKNGLKRESFTIEDRRRKGYRLSKNYNVDDGIKEPMEQNQFDGLPF